MKITYNSAYVMVQTGTLNITFAQQAILV